MFEGPVQDLIDELGKLPGIGPKSAQRIAFYLLSVEPRDIDRLTAVLGKVLPRVKVPPRLKLPPVTAARGAAALKLPPTRPPLTLLPPEK